MARDIEELPVTVNQWRNRGSIPPKYWPKIIKAALDLGHSLTLADFIDGESATDIMPFSTTPSPEAETKIIGAAA